MVKDLFSTLELLIVILLGRRWQKLGHFVLIVCEVIVMADRGHDCGFTK